MIRIADKKDLDILASLAVLMWNKHSVEELKEEFAESVESGDAQFSYKHGI